MTDQSERGSGKRLLSQKDYADARGWSKQYVNQLIKKGRILLVDGQIDPEQADRALGRTRDPSRAAAFRSDGMGESANIMPLLAPSLMLRVFTVPLPKPASCGSTIVR